MALSAGSVYAVLGGRFDPAGFTKFDGAMKKTVAGAQSSERAITASSARSSASIKAMAAKAAADVERLALAQKAAAIQVTQAQAAATRAQEKYGASSAQAALATDKLTLAQDRLALANRNLAGAQARASAANTQLSASSAGAGGAMAKMGSVAKNGAAIGLVALAYGIGKSVSAAANFDQAMSDLQSVTKASTADMKLMRNAALELGAKTGVGARQAAGAMAELAKGGLSTKQTIGALAGTIAMSQAGSMDLATAANTVAQSLNLFRMRGEDATHVADAFATAANATTADVGFFAQGLAQGGAAAKAAGLSFDETTAALEVLAANGFKSGSDAGTSLKTALIQLAAPSKRAQAEMDKLNISLFDSQNKIKPLSQISRELGKAWGDMTNKERLASAAHLVGTDGMRALLALYDQGPEKVGAFQRGLAAQGTASEMARQKMDNLKGATQRIGAQLQTIGITIGTSVMPYLKTAADEIVRFLDSLNSGDIRATGFGRFLQDMARFAAPIIQILGALARAAAWTLRALSNVPGNKWMKPLAAEAEAAANGIGKLLEQVERLRDQRPKPIKVPVTVNANDLQATLGLLRQAKLMPLVQKIMGNDDSVQAKIKSLRRLGIPGPIAKFLAEYGNVTAAINALKNKNVIIPVNWGDPGSLPSAPRKRKASGRFPGGAETALVGEGGGPEYVGNPSKGFRRVDGATVMGLAPDDYVIPTESKYRGRALALMADALGIPAFKAGKGPSKKELARRKRVDSSLDLLGTSADTASTEMQTAVINGDRGAWTSARGRRVKALEKERAKLLKELKRVKKGPRRVQLRNKLATVRNEIASTNAEAFELEAPEAGTDYSGNLRVFLDKLDSDIAVAELTSGTEDDARALGAKEKFLAGALAAAQANPALYGGAATIGQIATDLKSTRDQIKSLSATPDLTADQQAQADQAYQRGLAAGQTSFIDRLTNATMQGSPTLVFQSYVPPSPSEAKRLADYTVGGIGYQGSRPSSSERIGA